MSKKILSLFIQQLHPKEKTMSTILGFIYLIKDSFFFNMLPSQIKRILKLFGKGVIEILLYLESNPDTYNSIIHKLKDLNISKSWSAVKLKELVRDGIISRELINDSPPRTMYAITEKGLKLLGNIRNIAEILFSE
ncbi:MAG: winged helix-turn-helix transcriptional regulator [Promethearchaeota archaeon]